MENSNIKSLTGPVKLLLKTNKDFPQKLKQHLLFQSNKVENPFQFIVGLFTVGVLSDGSNDPEGSFGLKEIIVQLAMMITCSKGAEAIGGLMKALEDSGNSQFICDLRTWVKHDFGIGMDTELSQAKGALSITQTSQSERLPKNMTRSNEMNDPSGNKLIGKITSHVDYEFMEQLESHLVHRASQLDDVQEFGSSLVNQKVLDEADAQLKAASEAQDGQRIAKVIQAACSQKTIGSLVSTLQSSNNERMLEEAYEWFETSQVRKMNNPIAVKSLPRQRIEEESKSVRSSIFDRAALSSEVSNLGTFRSLQRSCKKGTIGVQFDKKRMMACSADGTLNLWEWQGYEQAIQVAGNVNNITSFQCDDEILLLGTAEGTVYLFDARTFEEKSSVKLREAVISLKFIESTLVVITGRANSYTYWCVDISRPGMKLLNQRSVNQWMGCKGQIPSVLLDPHTSFVYNSNMVYVYDTRSGHWKRDDKKRACNLLAPSVISCLSLGDLILTKRVVVAGCIDGRIVMWNTSKLVHDQRPVKTFWGQMQPIVSLCFLNGHLMSLSRWGTILMWSGHELECSIKPVPRLLMENSNFTHLTAHERWFPSCSSKDDLINMWTLPDLWLRTG